MGGGNKMNVGLVLGIILVVVEAVYKINVLVENSKSDDN